jgi:hypothetical protein
MLYYATLWYECSVMLCYGKMICYGKVVTMLSNGTDYHDIVLCIVK